MIYLLDTDICIFLLRGVPGVRNRLSREAPEDCVISSVTVFELFAGAQKSSSPAREWARIERLLAVTKAPPFDGDAARQAGRIRVQLEKQGNSIGPYDLLIAGHALALDLTLATGNTREFSRVAGLRVEDWSKS